MASAAAELWEPHVLAHAKARLFPEDDRPGTYAVVDTQFARDTWLDGESVDAAVREQLAPYNHVRIGGGYPDLIGVGPLDSELLGVERLGDEPPLVAVEAKGVTAHGAIDVQRGVVQAYDRLAEANVAYLAAPARGISQTDRSLAERLNVGILGVEEGGTVEPVVTPRVVGKRSTDEASAIRFQAGAQGVADQSFGLNHPKNYLGYVLAHHATGATAELLEEYSVVGATDDARRGAAFLGLVEVNPDGVALTPLGRDVVRFALARHGSVEAALGEFEQWYRTADRFYDVAPVWGELTRRVVFAYPATRLLVEELQALHGDGLTAPSLVDLVVYLHQRHPAFTVELFVRGEETIRRRVLTEDGELRESQLADGGIYHAPTVFQLKTMLFHAGLLTTRGTEPSRLEPTADVWALREPV